MVEKIKDVARKPYGCGRGIKAGSGGTGTCLYREREEQVLELRQDGPHSGPAFL